MLGDKVILTVRTGPGKTQDLEVAVRGPGGTMEMLVLEHGAVSASALNRKGELRESVVVSFESLVSARLVLR